MVTESFMSVVGWPIVAGLFASFAVEAMTTPRPAPLWRRPVSALLIHLGLYMSVFTILLAVVGRPWFAVVASTTFLLLVVLVNHAKFQSLREPFLFQDFEYFSDALRHPRLYLPFLGWGKATFAVTAFFLAAYLGVSLEVSLRDHMALGHFYYGVCWMTILSVGLMGLGVTRDLHPVFEPIEDVRRLGWLSSLWSYGRAERKDFPQHSPLIVPTHVGTTTSLPHVVAVQGESFFDPRGIFPGIRPDVLEHFDELRAESCLWGPLIVPAWGANTVRTEFAFLSGLDAMDLGVHKFNPYRKLQRMIPTIASLLKEQGYRTICIHPYSAGFYERDRILPLLGFDEFLDIRDFRGAQRVGPFVSDLAVAQKIESVFARSSGQPLFLFVITMENHGPLHLEHVDLGDIERFHSSPPPKGCEDLTVYLRHLANADRMAGRLRSLVDSLPRDGWIAWFGDHVPIMPGVYRQWGAPNGNTEYVLWRKNGRHAGQGASPLRVEKLGSVLLAEWAHALRPACVGAHNIAVPRHPSGVHV